MKKQQMKLESLSGSKFEAFKGNEITNTIQILGGDIVGTKNDANNIKDTYDTSSGVNNEKDGKDVKSLSPTQPSTYGPY